MKIQIINARTLQPSNAYDFFVDRRTPVGNPFPMAVESDRERVCEKYDEWFQHKIESNLHVKTFMQTILDALRKHGKVRLFCWCAPKRCHAETLRAWLIANAEDVCTCGNPELGFECACQWIRNNPGNKTYSCDFCGLYTAARPKCNECEEY